MLIYKPRFEIPSAGILYYNNKSGHGNSPCITGNLPRGKASYLRTGVAGLNVLPNCVGYAVGRFNEIAGRKDCGLLASVNAFALIYIAKNQGLRITNKPTLGGCMVWSGGKTGAGHAAIVEQIIDGNHVRTSESEWNGDAFRSYVRFGSNWRGGCEWMGTNYKYAGCISNPAVTEETMTQAEFNAAFETALAAHEASQARKNASDYAKATIEWAEKNGLIQGDAFGNTMPQSYVKRQDLILILNRFAAMLNSRGENDGK